MLVPTTILAQQHYQTFRDRFRDTAVEIEVVSRFRGAADLKGAIAGFRDGKVDILIGTHRVLSRDIVPAELGLVVVDEEQRFGVAQKEILRQLRTEVDVMAMSATPIPRSLHMSLSGLRDISVIATPPRGRRPVRTHVGEYDAGAGRQGDPPRDRPGRAGVLPSQPRRVDRRRRRGAAPAGAGGARVGRPRPDDRAPAGDRHGELRARRRRRAVRDHDHRGRPRHPLGQHADRRASRPARPLAAVPDPRPRRPLRRAGARLPVLSRRGRR